MTSGIASKGVDLDSIFDPYQSGTTKARAAGIGVAGSDISNRYAALTYGSAAAATGIKSESADLNTLYAKKGTANYKLAWDGSSFRGDGTGPNAGSAFGKVVIQFQSPSQYTITTSGTGNTTVTHTYSVPAGVTEFYIAATKQSSMGTGATETNSAGSWVQLASISAPTTFWSLEADISGNVGTNAETWSMSMYFGTGGSSIFSGTATVESSADISA